LCNLSAAAKQSSTKAEELLDLFDSPTEAIAWPKTFPYAAQNGTGPAPVHTSGVEEKPKFSEETDIKSKFPGFELSRTRPGLTHNFSRL
jgi:hypothetical protein